MPNDFTGITFNSPAQASKTMIKYLSSSAEGRTILSAGAYPQRYFPSSENLGISTAMQENAIFAFKNNSVGLTDIETPTTILILSGPEQNQIKYQTNKFILQSIVKPIQERFQIIETFGEPSLYFYDTRTRIYTIQGVLFDGESPSQLNNPGNTPALAADKAANYWATAFQDFYETYLRGTVLVRQGWIAAMYINNWYIKGYPLQLTLQKTADNLPQTVGFQMTWAIKKETLLSSPQAKRLYQKNRLSPETITAYNNYLGALTAYQAAYDAFAKATANGYVAKDFDPLITARDKAAANCASALIAVEQAMAKDAASTNTGAF
jgi:hypothetical protein